MSQVKCRFCGEQIDKESAYQDKERRGWYFCSMEHFIESQKKIDNTTQKDDFSKSSPYSELVGYIYKLYNKRIPPFVFRQIKDFTTRSQPMTYKGIELSLRYWVDTLGNQFDGSTGIGIVEYVYDQAEHFWRDKQRIRLASQDMKSDKILAKSGCQNRVDIVKYNLKRRAKNDLQSNSESNGSRNDYE